MRVVPVSVIVLSWNGIDFTKRCIDSLLTRTKHPDFEVIVVDNGSTDGTLEYLRGTSGIKLIENKENLGFVKGNNVGIFSTQRDVVLLNNDTEIIQSDWLERMQNLAYSAEDIGVVAPRLVGEDLELVHAGTYMPIPSFWGQEYPAGEKDIGQYSRSREVEGVIAACVYIKRSLIEEIGPLDEDFFSYYEDTDYCLRAKAQGYRVFCCGDVTVKHAENASTNLNRMDFSATFRRSRETFLSKWKSYYENFFSRKLSWRSCISGDDFLSIASRSVLKELEKKGVYLTLSFLEGAEKAELDDFRINDMKNRADEKDSPLVTFAPCESLKPEGTRVNIGYTFTPYLRFAPVWISEMQKMDEVWVTSEFQKEAAISSGLRKEVHVIEPGVDPDYFHPDIKGYPLENRYAFLSIADWNDMYATESLLRSFTDEFGENENVVLILMAKSEGGGRIEHEVEGMNLPLHRAPIVFVIDQEVPFYQLGATFKSSDCFVSVERTSENAILPRLALACGVPVVLPRFGSAGSLIDGKAAFGYDARVVDKLGGLGIAEPDKFALGSALRSAFENKGAACEAAFELSEKIRSELSWEIVAERIIKRLESLGK
ncbi:MAG: glycosyltransferase [Actinomycetota bacterium]|nr:glycosyltransferase [Actinomycetota bacterium]